VCNAFIWRQQDATRNAIQMLGQCHFSHKELQNKSCNDIQDMLMTQKGINFNDMPTDFKRGTCCIREGDDLSGKWIIDTEIPIFTQDRGYIENTVYFREE
jgi:tRNA(His) 5'-end guanylyltransferase